MIPQEGKHVTLEVSCNLEQWMIRYAIYLALGLLSTVPRKQASTEDYLNYEQDTNQLGKSLRRNCPLCRGTRGLW